MKAPEAWPRGYVEDASEERTPLADCFSILLDPLDANGRYIHHATKYRGIPKNPPNDIHTIGRDRILPHTHRCSSKENGQNLPRTPEGNVADFDVIRCRLSMILHPGQFTIKLLAPRVDRAFNR